MVHLRLPERHSPPSVRHDGQMLLSRRWALFLLGVGVFQWLVWPNFLRNIWADPRSFAPAPGGGPTSFLIVHAVLTATQLLLGTAVIVLAVRGLRARPAG